MSVVKDITKQINEYGKNRTPFLFIFNFGLSKTEIYTLSEAAGKSIFFEIDHNCNHTFKNKHFPEKAEFNKQPVSYLHYQKAFKKVQQNIKLGNTYLLNLTFPTQIFTNQSLQQIFIAGQARYKLLYKDKFVVFSPEIFVSINNNTISSYPMKGTIDAGFPDAGTRLLNDPKEKAEHNTIVDLIRNDLSMVSKNVRVEKFRYLEKIKTNDKNLLQTSSKITGDLQADWRENLGNILIPLLPAGSVTGAPKKKTVEIIRETENYERGYYTGIFGYFDGHSLDSAVMIRYIEKTGDELFFKSGGGITCFSDCRSEYNEMIDKVYLPFE